MKRYPVRKVSIPPSLKAQPNGKLLPTALRDIKPNGRLHRLAADAWYCLRVQAFFDGVPLAHVGAYRPYEVQLALWEQRMSPTPTSRKPAVTRVWKGKTWWLRRGAPVASPGSSNHGKGLAIDAALKVNGKLVNITAKVPGKDFTGIEWLEKNAVRFGWCWEVADPTDPDFEAWHIVYFAGAKRTPDIVQYLKAFPKK